MQLGECPIQESELRCPREEGPKSDGDRSVRGTSIGFNLGFNRGVAVSMRPDRAFSFRRTMPGGRLSGCPARPRPAGPLLGKPPRLPRLFGGGGGDLLGILGILSRKAGGSGGTQVTSRRHTVLEHGVG